MAIGHDHNGVNSEDICTPIFMSVATSISQEQINVIYEMNPELLDTLFDMIQNARLSNKKSKITVHLIKDTPRKIIIE